MTATLDGPADTLIINGRAFRSGRPATAVAVRGDRIAELGTDRELATLRGSGTEVFDAAGGLILPGFDDAHMHLRHGALALDQLDLFGLTDLEAVQRKVRRYAEDRPDQRWIIGRGWFYAAFPAGMPTRRQLDEVVPDRPAFLMCFDGHSGWANSRALEIAGIDSSTPDPVDGRIVRDGAAEPTGALLERATELMEPFQPQPDDETKLRLTGLALDALARAGITAAQDAWAEPADFELLDRLRARRRLPLRLRLALEMLPGTGPVEHGRRLDEFEAVTRLYDGDAFLRGGILKSFLDGVVEARTAFLLEPYADTPSRGKARWDGDELRSALAEAHRRGWQVELHAIGNAAVRQALDAYETLGPGEAARRRHRIEHIETIDADDLPRFAKLGVVASMQPFHAIPESDQLDTWRSALHPHVADTGWRIGSLFRSGAALAFGSDWPVVPFDPFHGIHAGVNRQSVDGRPAAGWLPAERLSLTDALMVATSGSAFAEHADHERGSLAVGRLADLIVLDRDLMAEGPSAILDTNVRLTMVDGAIVHRLA